MNFRAKCMLIIFHPLDCFDIIKRERCRRDILVAGVFYFLAFVLNYGYIFAVHFPLSTQNPVDANLLLEAAMVVIPLFSWVVGSYLITSIMSGESGFFDVFVSSSYCLTPYIVLMPAVALLSQILSTKEAMVFNTLRGFVILWMLILLLAALQRLNDYSAAKTVIVAILSVAAIVIIWAICLLILSLTVQLVFFFTGIMQEFKFKL